MKYAQLKGYYTAGQTMDKLQITRMTLYKWSYEGKLHPIRTINKRQDRYFKMSEVDILSSALNVDSI